jgi:hypothetical protein
MNSSYLVYLSIIGAAFACTVAATICENSVGIVSAFSSADHALAILFINNGSNAARRN